MLLAMPLLAAAAINVLHAYSVELYLKREHIAGYAFLFAFPWGWVIRVIDRLPDVGSNHRTLSIILSYVYILWVPAVLDSVSIFAIFKLIDRRRKSLVR
jgi:hypothetical protein